MILQPSNETTSFLSASGYKSRNMITFGDSKRRWIMIIIIDNSLRILFMLNCNFENGQCFKTKANITAEHAVMELICKMGYS